MTPFAELLLQMCQEKNISKRELADKARLSAGYISHLTSGERKTPSEMVVRKLADALGLESEERAKFFQAANYTVESSFPHEYSPQRITRELFKENLLMKPPRVDWGEAPDTEHFQGREDELNQLDEWLLQERCRLVTILGLGGVGKTALATRFANRMIVPSLSTQDTLQPAYAFEYIFWRSLQSKPPLKLLLEKCLLFFSNQRNIEPLEGEEEQISRLLTYLTRHRCLLILDNFESLFKVGDTSGQYLEGYSGYGRLLQRLGETPHASCLIITAREQPREIKPIEGKNTPVRSMRVRGLFLQEVRTILQDEELIGDDTHWQAFIDLYTGNPLALKLVASSIRELFGGNIFAFCETGDHSYGTVTDLLQEQFDRLSMLERKIIYWLGIESDGISLDRLREQIIPTISMRALQEALDSLRRRSLIETTRTANNVGSIKLLPIIREYATQQLVEDLFSYIHSKKYLTPEPFAIFNIYPLMRAEAPDYTREQQERLIVYPLAERLKEQYSLPEIEARLLQMFTALKPVTASLAGYFGGNILNLILHLGIEPANFDFSSMAVHQAYLQGKKLHNVNFAGANLAHSVFTNTFGCILSVAISPDGTLLAAGTTNGEIRLWEFPSGTPHQVCTGHTDWVGTLAFSPDSTILASGCDDQTARFWDTKTGACLRTFAGHQGWVQAIGFSPDGQWFASGSEDSLVRLWRVNSEGDRPDLQLDGHRGKVYCLAFDPQGRYLASAGEDTDVHLWNLWERDAEDAHTVWRGHQGWVQSVQFSPNGKLLVSGSGDHTLRIWHVEHAGNTTNLTYQRTLRGHQGWVQSVAFDPTGELLASASEDRTVRIWQTSTWERIVTLRKHNSRVCSIAFSPDGQILVSGSTDQTIRFWDVAKQECTRSLQGYSPRVYSVAFSPDSRLLASSSDDQQIRFWDTGTWQLSTTLQEQGTWIYSIAFSPDGSLLATGSDDQTVRIWHIQSQTCLKTLDGHDNWIWAVIFSPDGRYLASAGSDQEVLLWETRTWRLLKRFQAHTGWVRALAFSPDSSILISGSEDHTLRLWEVESGRCLRVFEDEHDRIYAITFSPNGKTFAYGCRNARIYIREVQSGRLLQTLAGHSDWIWSLAFSPDGRYLASGSEDSTVRIWEVDSGRCIQVFSGHTSWIQSVSFLPDQERSIVASGSHDGTVKLWAMDAIYAMNGSNSTYHSSLLPTTLVSPRPYNEMNISFAKGLTLAQRAMLKQLGAVDYVDTDDRNEPN